MQIQTLNPDEANYSAENKEEIDLNSQSKRNVWKKQVVERFFDFGTQGGPCNKPKVMHTNKRNPQQNVFGSKSLRRDGHATIWQQKEKRKRKKTLWKQKKEKKERKKRFRDETEVKVEFDERKENVETVAPGKQGRWGGGGLLLPSSSWGPYRPLSSNSTSNFVPPVQNYLQVT